MTDRLSEIRARLAAFKHWSELQPTFDWIESVYPDLEWTCAYIERLEARLRTAIYHEYFSPYIDCGPDDLCFPNKGYIDAEMAKVKLDDASEPAPSEPGQN